MSTPDPRSVEQLLPELGWLDSLARTLVRESELAQEAVQETCLAALVRGPRGAQNFRGWLAVVARNAVRKKHRGESRRRARENDWAETRPTEISAEEAQAHFTLRHDLAQAVMSLTEVQREVILLRFVHDLTLREIADRLGSPISTVDDRIRRGLDQLRARLSDEYQSGSRAWAMLLLPVLDRQAGFGAARPVRLLTVLAGAIMAVGITVLVARMPTSETPAIPTLEVGAPTVVSSPREPELAFTPDERRSAAPALTTAPAKGAGSIVVVVRGADGAPVEGVFVRPQPTENAHRRAFPSGGRTDSNGRVKFPHLEGGSYRLTFDRLRTVDVEVVPDAETTLVRTLGGLGAAGIVVDAGGAPVADAEVWLSPRLAGWLAADRWVIDAADVPAVARTDADGRFSIHNLGDAQLLGARAAGFAPSQTLRVSHVASSLQDLRLRLDGPGGSAAGRVLDPDGRPLVGAVVQLDATGTGDASAPLFLTLTDETGLFGFQGVRPGVRQVRVHALGLLATETTIDVPQGGEAFELIRLEHGEQVTGTIHDPSGRPAVGVEVFASGPRPERGPGMRHVRSTRTNHRGRFELNGLPSGPTWISALGKPGLSQVALVEAPSDVKLVLAEAPLLLGRVVDEGGQGIAGCEVRAGNDQPPWNWRTSVTDDTGAFELFVADASPQHLRVLEHQTLVLESHGQAGIPLELVIADDGRPTSVVCGKAVTPDGAPADVQRMEFEPTDGGDTFQVPLESGPSGFCSGPVKPGTYRVRLIAAHGLGVVPGIVQLKPHREAHLGTVPLEAFLPLAITLQNEAPLRDLRLVVRNRTGKVVLNRSWTQAEPRVAHDLQLAAGRYSLLAWSATTIPSLVDFTVEESGPRALSIPLEAGAPREIILRPRPAVRVLEHLHLVLEGSGLHLDQLVAPNFSRTDGAYQLRLGLAPGSYDLRASVKKLSATFSFVVEADGTAAPPLEIFLD